MVCIKFVAIHCWFLVIVLLKFIAVHFLVMICSTCCVELSQHRDGKRHDLWLDLEHVNTGKLHLAITVLEKQNESLSSDETLSNSTTFEVWSISTSHVSHMD